MYHNPVVGAPDRSCVYFTVINNAGAPGPAAFTHAVHHAPVPANQHNIYFPLDGHQPTTEEAVQYSCANIDNREDSPITDWYMQMFGVMQLPVGGHVLAGLDRSAVIPAPVIPPVHIPHNIHLRIIRLHANVNGVLVNDPHNPTVQISRAHLFIREFRKIASTSVGRVLLYRILVEIRRQNNINDIRGRPEQHAYAISNINRRNNLRSIEIKYTNNDFSFSSAKRRINFAPILDRTTIIGKTNRGGYSNIVHNSDTVDISIFHEMIHWYHYLRYTNRYLAEPAAGTNPQLNEHFLGKYYWGALNCRLSGWRGQDITGRKWENGDDILDFEEVRTVLGVPYLGSIENYAQNYVQGDDLSENLYKMCIGNPLRFGYDGVGFYEDRKVINRVINACIENYGLVYNGL